MKDQRATKDQPAAFQTAQFQQMTMHARGRGRKTRTVLLLLLAMALSSCGGSNGAVAREFSARGGCLSSAAEPPVLISDNFDGAGGACGFSPLWEHTRGSVGNGFDGCALRYFLPAGTLDETTAAQVELNAAGLEALTGSSRQQYIRVQWRDYFDPDYAFPNSGQKLARFYDSAGGGSGVNVEVKENNQYIQLFFIVRDGDRSAEYFVNHSQPWGFLQSGGIPLGEAIDFELEALLPSSESPGYAVLRYAGVELNLQTDAQIDNIVSDRCLPGFSGLWVGGNYSNAGPPVAADSSRFIDDVRVYAVP